MRNGTIDIDWLDAEIEDLIKKDCNPKGSSRADDIRFNVLLNVRSKCEPIEEVKQVIVDSQGGMSFAFTELPTKCVLDWESAKYCHNRNECKLCKENK